MTLGGRPCAEWFFTPDGVELGANSGSSTARADVGRVLADRTGSWSTADPGLRLGCERVDVGSGEPSDDG
jgi:hypothetical protein